MNSNFEIYLMISVLVSIPNLLFGSRSKFLRIIKYLSLTSILILSVGLTFFDEIESGNIVYLFGRNLLITQAIGCILFLYNIRSILQKRMNDLQPFVTNFLYISIIFAFGSLDVLTLYFSLSLMSIGILFYCSKNNLSSMLSLFYQTLIGEIALIIGLLFFVAATGSINTVSMNVINHEYMVLSFVFILSYSLFKLGSFPFNAWMPMISKNSEDKSFVLFGVINSSFALILIPFLQRLLLEIEPIFQNNLSSIINIVVMLSSFYGLLLAWKQDNVEKSFAYYCMSPIAIIILSINLEPSDELFALQIYYVLFTFVTMGLAHTIISELVIKNTSTNSSSLKGAFYLAKTKSISLIVLLISLFGMPFTVGFSIKSGLMLKYIEYGYVTETVIIYISSVLAFIIIFELITQLFKKEDILYPREIIGNNFPAQVIELVIMLSVIIGGVIPTIL